jgi:hypothetical protein
MPIKEKPSENSNSRPHSKNNRIAPIQKEPAPLIPQKKAGVPVTIMKKPILADFRIAD